MWTNSSDRNLKENFQPVDSQDVLDRLAGLPITTWNYRVEEPSIRHMGPVAQDFYATFGLGPDDRHIAALDAAGVALAAIQELYAENQALEEEVATLKHENAALRGDLDDLEARVAALERTGTQVAQSPSSWWLLPRLGVAGGVALRGRRRTELER